MFLLSSTILHKNVSTAKSKLNYLNFFSKRLYNHYSFHCNEIPPMLSVSEFMQSLNKNQLFIKITVQRDDFVNHDYPFGCYIPFDNDSVRVTDCKISPKNYLFIID